MIHTIVEWVKMGKNSLSYAREKEHVIYYDDIVAGKRRADFVVENKIVVELKARVHLEPGHFAQAKNYVIAYDFPLGLLINFGSPSLEYKLMFNPKYPVKMDFSK